MSKKILLGIITIIIILIVWFVWSFVAGCDYSPGLGGRRESTTCKCLGKVIGGNNNYDNLYLYDVSQSTYCVGFIVQKKIEKWGPPPPLTRD